MNKFERMPPSNDLLKTFLEIAESENLTLAATRLNRTQSAISVQLRKLEETLRVPLFDHHARGMTLNDKGRQFLPAARRALAELQRTTTLFDQPITGSIAVGIPDDFDDMILETALAEFAAQNPGVEITAQSGCTAHFPDALKRGELDIAVCSGPHSLPGEALSVERSVWVCGLSYVLDHDAPLPLAILDRDCWWRDIPSTALEAVGRDWKPSYRSSSFSSLRAAIRAGLGVGVLPAGSVDTGMRVLAAADDLPPLPLAHRVIMVRADAPKALTSAMAATIQEAVQRR